MSLLSNRKVKNTYFQYFCGLQEFVSFFPCNASELVHFRKRIGEKGIELILAESIRVNDDKSDGEHHDTAFIDSTVQEKNVTYPTDAKLHKKIVGKVLGIVQDLNLPLRQSYKFVLKKVYRNKRFRNHPKNRKKTIKADKRLCTLAGRLVRELERNFFLGGGNHHYDKLLSIFKKILSQGCNPPVKFIPFMNRMPCASVRAARNIKIRIWE